MKKVSYVYIACYMKCELLICEDNCITECDTLHSRRFTNILEDLAGSVPKNGVGMSLKILLELLIYVDKSLKRWLIVYEWVFF